MEQKYMILLDTNIIIEIYRSNRTVIDVVTEIGQENMAVSEITCSELYFGARDKKELRIIEKDLSNLTVIPVNSTISTLSTQLVKQHALSHKLTIPDALIAATAMTYNIPLYTLNIKDFIYLKSISLYAQTLK